MLRSSLLAVLVYSTILAPGLARAQVSSSYDASWYDADAPHVRIAVVEDGVYRVTGAALQSALPAGTTLGEIPDSTLRLYENGQEIPLHVSGPRDGTFGTSDAIHFVGHRNRGTDELWAYETPSDQSSPYRSLYTDTTHYWLTWGGETTGQRYTSPSFASTTPTASLRDTVHVEEDNRYYYGRPYESGDAFYTESEGYYWRRFSHNNTGTIQDTYTLPVSRRTNTSDQLNLSVRLDAETNSCHRVRVEAELQQSGGGVAFEALDTVEWQGYQRQTVTASIDQNRVPSDLRVRIVSINQNFSDSNCPAPGSTPNYVLLDYLEADYVRRLAASNDAQRFVAPLGTNYTFSLSGYSSSRVEVYNPADARRYVLSTTGGTGTVSASPTGPNTPFWTVGQQSFKSPASLRPDKSSDWSVASAHGADYVILTTEALLSSARELAEYRRTQSDYEVAVVQVQNVFDEFDYGRPTPIAIRRFARATQSWSPAPQFLTIFADAPYPIDPGLSRSRAEWAVPSFGYSPSDGWYAMQATGPNDWTEFLAIGRIPVRNNAQGELFIDKLSTYENADPAAWQKRMMLLAGGTNESEQSSLQFYSNQWGELATGTADTLYAAGMDTLRYYKQADDALDTSFQDSLSVDLERGAGWLSYFGHSAAQTWEIVTEAPKEWENAGRLPVILSLGCKTGSFAGGRYSERSAPSLGEQLVVGTLGRDSSPVDGARSGGIAHWGTSALGNRLPSARLGDELTRRVFQDTMRVLGTAIQEAKASIARDFGSSSLYQRHLLTYGLLGDPATRIAIADQPDFHLSEDQISISPSAPVPAEPLSVNVTLRNYGLVPRDSVGLQFTWQRPDGSQVQRTARFPRFALHQDTSYTFIPDERALGPNTFRAVADWSNTYDEANETNNSAEQTQVVFDTGIDLIRPADQGIVQSPSPTLRTSVLRRTTETVPVQIQLDSVPDFSSPARQEARLDASSAVTEWSPSRALQEGTTYYWRARVDRSDPPSSWTQASFTVRSSFQTDGWMQQNRQFQVNRQNRLSHQGPSWTFDSFTREIITFSERGSGSRNFGFVVGGSQRYVRLGFGFGVLVIDGKTGRVKGASSFPTYELPDRFTDPEIGDTQQAINSLRDFLDQHVESGDYVFTRTRHLAGGGSAPVPDEVTSLFQNLGSSPTSEHYSTAIDTLTYDHLWVMKARYGFPDATVEQVSPPSEASSVNEIELSSTPSFRYPRGTTTTPLIGPVTAWETMRWQTSPSDASDDLQIDVLARDSTLLVSDVNGLNGERDLSSIDPSVHPYVRLRATLTDSTTRTAPNLARWSVGYTGVPELLTDPAQLQSIPDTLQEGASQSVSLPVFNLGPVASAPVRVRYDLVDATNRRTTLAIDTLGVIDAGAEKTSSLSFSTADRRSGATLLAVTVESDGPPERITYNNTALRNFHIQSDDTPPTLEVLAEGRELPPTPDAIQNLQDPSLPFVPTNPTLEIQVRDNNPYLRLKDTSYVEVYLKEGLPSDGPDLISNYQRIPFSGPTLTFQAPEDDEENRARVLYEPTLPSKDQTYTLKVEAQDAQGNEGEPHAVTFRVQTEQVITDLYPYPNPMSDHTQFAFQVQGGNTRPTDFSLRIYTLSGRLVREFEGSDVNEGTGLRKTGWNMLTWNGRDEDGDRVATGVYLYRVRMEGEDGTFEGDVEKIAVIR